MKNTMREIFGRLALGAKVHCIINYMTAKDVANTIKAIGAEPFLSDDPDEVKDMTEYCDGLYIDMGTLNFRTTRSMMKAGLHGKNLGKVMVFAPVGAGRAEQRTITSENLLKDIRFSIILGDEEELCAIGDLNKDGFVAKTCHNTNDRINLCKEISDRYGAVVVMVGDEDIVADGDRAYLIGSKPHEAGRIVEYNSMLGGLLTVFASAAPDRIFESALLSTSVLSYSTGLAAVQAEKMGTGIGGFSDRIIGVLGSLKESDIDNLNTMEYVG